MAKKTLTGNAFVVESTIKFEDIKFLEKYDPRALVIHDDEKDADVYAVFVGYGPVGKISKCGISFNGASHNGEGLATCTVPVCVDEEHIMGFLADNFGKSIEQLEKLEAELPQKIEQLRASRQAFMDSVELV